MKIAVCANCWRASCWQGHFYCDEAKNADIVELEISQLVALGLEHPDYWRADPERRSMTSDYVQNY